MGEALRALILDAATAAGWTITAWQQSSGRCRPLAMTLEAPHAVLLTGKYRKGERSARSLVGGMLERLDFPGWMVK